MLSSFLKVNLRVVLALVLSATALEKDGEVSALPGYDGPLKQRILAGLVPANETTGSALYYILYESRASSPKASTPIVVWINGGPGASSALGNLLGHGPYRLVADGDGVHGLVENPHAWNSLAHVMYVDQPGGTGYSRGPPPGSLSQVASEFGEFLVNFFDRHPDFSECPIFLAGESFAGVFQPMIGAHIATQIPALAKRLRGIILGNPGIFHHSQYHSVIPYAVSHGLIGEAQAHEAEKQYANCVSLLEKGQNYAAFVACQGMADWIIKEAGSPFVYDIRKWGDQFSKVMDPAEGSYCRNETVKKALHVPGRDWNDGDGTAKPNEVFNALKNEMLTPVTPSIEALHQHRVPIVIYNGVYDACPCNHMGAYDYILSLDRRMMGAREVWTIPGVDHPLGYWQAFDGIDFVWISNSGHMVPLDQPVACLSVLQRAIRVGMARTHQEGASADVSDVVSIAEKPRPTERLVTITM